MAREDMIRQDMQLVGTYNAIFEPTIKQLAKTERELSRAEKEWKKQGGQRICTMVNKTGAEYTAKSPYWTAVEDLRATVQGLRNQLGLTPTGLNKARAKSVPMGGASKLEQLLSESKSHAEEHAAQYQREVDSFVEATLSGENGLCEDAVLACKRYVSDLDTGKWEFRTEPANEIIAIIETMICHQQGEFLDATPLRGTPFLLLPYHKFIVYNIMGFYLPGTKIRRFKEAVDFIPRKNVKTTFAAALAFALALYERASGSKVYEVGGALKQALEGFDFLKYNCTRLGVTVKDEPETGLRIIDNNMERSISGDVGDGMISINALAANPDKQDSFNCNIVIADEAHTYKSPQQYQILKDATKAYTNKLVIIISSNGPNARGFLLVLCIARIMLCDPSVLILDEATSSIDTTTEMRIQQAFLTLMEGRTSFIVAHRLSTIKGADLILVMKEGTIIEQGTHASLLADKGFYYHLYNSQFPETDQLA